MTAIDNTPTNKNFLSPINFSFQIKKAPNVNFFIQEVSLPKIDLHNVDTSNPFVTFPFPGDHITYDVLSINFKVDEDLENYMEIHNWIKGLGKPETFQQYADLDKNPSYSGNGIYSDISLIIMSNIKNPNFNVTFKDAFPISLSGLNFNSTKEDINYLTASASFKYTLYDITKFV